MTNQNLFNTLCEIYEFPPTEQEMQEILDAIERDERELLIGFHKYLYECGKLRTHVNRDLYIDEFMKAN